MGFGHFDSPHGASRQGLVDGVCGEMVSHHLEHSIFRRGRSGCRAIDLLMMTRLAWMGHLHRACEDVRLAQSGARTLAPQ